MVGRVEGHVERISSGEAISLLGLFYSAGLAAAPIRLFSVAGYSAWIAGALAGLIGLAVALLWARAGSIHPDEELPQSVVRLLGRPLGLAVNLLLLAYFLSGVAVDVRITGEVLLQLMPETPLFVFAALTLAFAVVVARLGLEVLARIATFHSGLVAVAFVLVIASLAPILEVNAYRPVLEDGWAPVLSASLTPAAHIGQAMVIAVVAPRLFEPLRSGRRSPFRRLALVSLAGAGIAWFYQFSFLLIEQGVFGPEMSMRLAFPALEVAREVQIGPFFERVEAALVAVWLPSIMLKTAAFLYAASVALKPAFRSEAYRGHVLPLACLAGAAALYGVDNIWDFTRLLNGPWAAFALAVEVFVPLLFLGASSMAGGARRGG